MKILVVFALVAAASAIPEPVTLPRAPLPTIEDVKPVVLPKAEPLPFESNDAILQLIDISPVFVPEEVMEELRQMEIKAEPVNFVDNSDVAMPDYGVKVVESPEAVEAANAGDFAVHVVDIAQEAAPVAESVDAVRVVEIPAPVSLPISAGELESIRIAFPIPAAEERIVPDAVRVVDSPPRGPGKVFDNALLR